MSILLGILLTLFILLIVVLIHELGHFVTARLTWMQVEEFGIGIPPKLFKIGTDKHGTEYTLNWLPIGGFVRILWENPGDIHSYNKWAFITKWWFSRVLVLSAGVIMNFFLAFLIFTFLFFQGVSPMTVIPMENTQSRLLPSIQEAIDTWFIKHNWISINPVSWGLAERAGLKTWDQIVAINNIKINSTQEIIGFIQQNKELKIQVAWKSDIINIIPENGKIGIGMEYDKLRIDSTIKIKYGLQDAIIAGWEETIATTKITYAFLVKMFNGIFSPKNQAEHEQAKNMLSWPIWLGSTFVWIIENSVPITIIMVMVALISINLWVVNILPFPALDGWRIVTTTFYSIFSYFPRGKIYFSQFETALHTVGFLILITLMLYVSGLDILRFF